MHSFLSSNKAANHVESEVHTQKFMLGISSILHISKHGIPETLKSVLPGILSCKVAGSLVTMKKQCRIFRHKSFTRNTERLERKIPFGFFTS
jgi:hypothetical protein